jgi:transposase
VLGVFSKLSYAITLEFIRSLPTPQAASALTFDQSQAFARQHHHSRPRKLPAMFTRLQAPQPEAAIEVVQIYQQEVVTLASLLLEIVHARTTTEKVLKKLFVQHPDHEIFASLPGVGALLGLGLLVKFGDDRRRFPSAASVQGLAGTCPVTKRSGKRKTVHFRFACDRDFRYIATQWARHSKDDSMWASAYYHQVLARSGSKSHAHRCLANRWLGIAWKLWQTREPYDEAYHLRRLAERRKPKNVIFIE